MTHINWIKKNGFRFGLGLALALVLLTSLAPGDLPASVAQVSVSEDCPENMLGYWKLDEQYVDEPAEERVYADHTFPYFDAGCGKRCPVSTQDGIVSGAQIFNGTNTGLNIPAATQFDWGGYRSFSLELWMKTAPGNTCRTYQTILGRNSQVIADNDEPIWWWLGCRRRDTYGVAHFGMTTNDGTVHYVRDGEGTPEEPDPAYIDIADGGWHHLVVVRAGGVHRLHLYVDGQFAATRDTSDPIIEGDLAYGTPINIGWLDTPNVNDYHFEGTIDEVAIYSRALTPEEIALHYHSGLAGQGPCTIFAIDKTASADLVHTGELVTYDYAVTNVAIDPLTNVSNPVDDRCSPVNYTGGDTNVNGRLEEGETWTYTCSQVLYTTTTNVVTISAEDLSGSTLTASDEYTVQVINPNINFTKTATPSIADVGQLISYSYTAENTGNDSLTNVSVTDDMCSPVLLSSGDNNHNNQLDEGETWIYSCSQTLYADTTNTATFSAQDSGGNPVTETTTAFVDVIDPDMSIAKTPTHAPAGPITYRYSVANEGDDPLHNIGTPTDNTCSPVIYSSGDNGNNLLDVGETWTYTCQSTLTTDTPCTVQATGVDSLGRTLTRVQRLTVRVIAPAIEVTKTASAGSVPGGTSVTYTYEVANIGDTPLTDIRVTDDKCASVRRVSNGNGDQILDRDETWTFDCTTRLVRSTTNTATARGTDLGGGYVTDTDTAYVEVTTPPHVYLPIVFNGY